MALPPGVSTCRVDLRLIEARVDGSDPDREPVEVVLEPALRIRDSSRPA